MKILGKYKDYYDYLTGVYGIDEKLVLDRRFLYAKPVFSDNITIHGVEYINIAFCNNLYQLAHYNNKFYFLEKDYLILIDDLKANGIIERVKYNYEDIYKVKLTTFNMDSRYPILLNNKINKYSNEDKLVNYFNNFLLKDYDFYKIIPAEKAFQEISLFLGWLNDHPEIPNKQTNKEKILSHGFDLKQSFRHRL